MRNSFLYNLNNKNSVLKQSILKLCIKDGDYNIADISRELNISIPKTTKLISELMEEGFLEDKGKIGTNGGRRPNMYGLNPEVGYFVGVEIRANSISIALTDFKGAIIDFKEKIPFALESTEESIIKMCSILKKRLAEIEVPEEKILAYGFSMTGRVNTKTGYSFSYFLGENNPIDEKLKNLLNAPVFIDNDSRAMTYGEYMCGVCNGEQNVIFINLSMGLGMGMIVDGKLVYGKSGFSGEFGHFPLLNNEKICKCGKVGCLETGTSGLALHDLFIEKLEEGRASILSEKYNNNERITVQDILAAVIEDDFLAIECFEEIGSTLGRAIAGLINIFNPELVVIGGTLAAAKDNLLLPVKAAINKYTLTMVCKDTEIKLSKLGTKTGPVGACVLSRSKLLGFI